MSIAEADLRHVSFEGRPIAPRAGGRPEHSTRHEQATEVARVAPPAPSRPAARSAESAFARSILDRAGLDGEAYREESLRRRTAACMRALKARSEREAHQRLTHRPDLLAAAVSSLLIGVTGFFRDPDVFDGLRSTVLPVLAGCRRPLRIWSAGCAWGAEPYSFAILLAQAGLLDRAYLLGTDCRPDAIEQARGATCEADRAGALNDTLFREYFEPLADGTVRPTEALRRRMHWKVADFLQAAERGPWDVIFWRNAAIYLDAGPAAIVWGRLAAQLASDGFLVAGKAERPPATVNLAPVSRCIYRKRGA